MWQRDNMWPRDNIKFINFTKFFDGYFYIHLQILNSNSNGGLILLTHFRPMFDLCRNQVIGFIGKIFEKHLWKSDILSIFT